METMTAIEDSNIALLHVKGLHSLVFYAFEYFDSTYSAIEGVCNLRKVMVSI